MDDPVEDTEHVERLLADAFIRTMEIISDSGTPANNLHKLNTRELNKLKSSDNLLVYAV